MAPPDAETIRALTQALHDSLMVIAPPGWAEVDLDFTPTPEGLRLTSLSARGKGTTAPAPRAALNIDPNDEALRLGEGLTELAGLLATAGKSWPGGRAQVVRTEAFTDWKLLAGDGSVRWFSRLLPPQLDGLLFTDALFDLLRASEKGAAALQQAFAARLGPTIDHDYDEASRMLTLTRLGGKMRAPAEVVGTYSRESFLWVWGWAVDELDPACSAKVRASCAPEAQQPGLSALWRPWFHCDEGFAWALATALLIPLGARGLVRAEAPGSPNIVIYALLAEPG